ncbi:MAG: hypothetical protein ACK518_02285 [bacterium]
MASSSRAPPQELIIWQKEKNSLAAPTDRMKRTIEVNKNYY